MPIASFELLNKLIDGLGQSEKRHFVLNSKRMDSTQNANYMKLFELIEKNPDGTELSIRSKLGLNNQSFTNTKRHLYSRILKSLRLKGEEKNTEMILRQKLSFATLLYERNELEACKRILKSSESLALNTLNRHIALEYWELQKEIESRHITRSRKKTDAVERLIKLSESTSHQLRSETQMLNVSLEVHGLYFKWGFVKSEKDLELYETFFKSIMPELKAVQHSSLAEIYWWQCHTWYRYMRLEFDASLKAGMKWIEMIELDARLIKTDPDLYLRGLHYVTTLCFYLEDHQRFEVHYRKLSKFILELGPAANATTKVFMMIYGSNAEINLRLLRKQFNRLNSFVQKTEESYAVQAKHVDTHRHMILDYKVAMMYAYNGKYDLALDYINSILESKVDPLRNDILCYSRLIQLYCHYCCGNYELVGNLMPNVKSNFDMLGHGNKVVVEMFTFLKKGCLAMNFGLHDLIESTLAKLNQLKTSKFDKVAFLYFDHINWIRSINQNVPIDKL